MVVSNIFDRKLLKRNRDLASINFSECDFLFKEVAKRIIERVEDLKGDFTNILEIGARNGFLGKEIKTLKNSKLLIQTDSSPLFVKNYSLENGVVLDEENLNFSDASFDLIVSNLNLHFVNDVLQHLVEIKKLLKPNGVLIASFFGGETLRQLREVLLEVEQKKYNGISPRIALFAHVKDAGMLIQRAGFKDAVADSEIINVVYSDFFKLLKDIKNMGEGNIMYERSKKFVGKDFFSEAKKLYLQNNGLENDGEIEANFEIITVIGWQQN